MMWTVPGDVVGFWDGDSIRLYLDLGWKVYFGPVLCRVDGIDAPELGGDPGSAARDYARLLLPVGSRVFFRSKELDKYGRPLGDVMLPDGRDFAEEMVAAGHAVPYGGGSR